MNWISSASPLWLGFDESKEDDSFFLNEAQTLRGMLHSAVMNPLHCQFLLRPRSQAGFVLPLALTVSAVLLLGSASIHTLSLQKRLRIHASHHRQLGADQLRSVAQSFAVTARGLEACLLQWPSLDWPGAALDCPGSDPPKLSRGVVGEKRWSLLDWQPSTDRGHLKVQLADGRTSSFLLVLDPLTFEVIEISDVQLQARVPQLEVE